MSDRNLYLLDQIEKMSKWAKELAPCNCSMRYWSESKKEIVLFKKREKDADQRLALFEARENLKRWYYFIHISHDYAIDKSMNTLISHYSMSSSWWRFSSFSLNILILFSLVRRTNIYRFYNPFEWRHIKEYSNYTLIFPNSSTPSASNSQSTSPMKTPSASSSTPSPTQHNLHAIIGRNHKRISNLTLSRLALGTKCLWSLFSQANTNLSQTITTLKHNSKSSSTNKLGIYWETKVNSYLELLH